MYTGVAGLNGTRTFSDTAPLRSGMRVAAKADAASSIATSSNSAICLFFIISVPLLTAAVRQRRHAHNSRAERLSARWDRSLTGKAGDLLPPQLEKVVQGPDPLPDGVRPQYRLTNISLRLDYRITQPRAQRQVTSYGGREGASRTVGGPGRNVLGPKLLLPFWSAEQLNR